MRHVVGAALLFLTLFAETTSAQIAAPQPVRAATCKAGRSAAGRLICVDPDLLALESHSRHSVPRCQNYCIAGSPAVAATGTAGLDT